MKGSFQMETPFFYLSEQGYVILSSVEGSIRLANEQILRLTLRMT